MGEELFPILEFCDVEIVIGMWILILVTIVIVKIVVEG